MEPFKVLQPYGVLVCELCQHACLVREASTHLRAKHRHFSAPQRAAIQKAVGRLPGLFETQKALEFFSLPTDPVPAVPELAGPHHDGLRYTQCPYIARRTRTIQEHCRTTHGWENSRGRGGNVKKKTAISGMPWRSGVPCQRFFTSRRASSWFEVIVPCTSLPGSPGNLASNPPLQAQGEAFITALLSDFNQAKRRTTTIQDNEGKAEPNPWLRRVGWAEHFQEEDPNFIYSMAILDANEGWGDGDHTTDQEVLERACESLRRVVLSAQAACCHEEVGLPVLFEVGRKTIYQKPSTPFNARLEPRTIDRYINVWRRVVGYVFRTAALDEDRRPAFEFTPQQQNALVRFQYRIRRTMGSDGPDERAVADIYGLDRACLDFLITLLDHELQQASYDSVLLSALAAIGIREDGGWLQPDEYTPFYSAVIKVARMLVVRQSQLEAEESEDARLGLFAIVRQKVHRYMTVVHDASIPTPID